MTSPTPTKRQLKASAHHLHPLVIVGQQGLTPQVLNQIDGRIRDHELVKVKIAVDDRVKRKEVVDSICQQLAAQLVQTIGKTATFYRQAHNEKGEGMHSALAATIEAGDNNR